MTSVLSPVAPPGAFARDALTTLLSAAHRAAAPVAKVESARAVKPVDIAPRPEPIRNQTQHERPVGPPPSFEINVLQDIRTRLADPPEAADVIDEHAREAETIAQADTPEPPARAAVRSEAEAPHLLDLKV